MTETVSGEVETKPVEITPEVEDELTALARQINAKTIPVFLAAEEIVKSKVPEKLHPAGMEIFLKKRQLNGQ